MSDKKSIDVFVHELHGIFKVKVYDGSGQIDNIKIPLEPNFQSLLYYLKGLEREYKQFKMKYSLSIGKEEEFWKGYNKWIL